MTRSKMLTPEMVRPAAEHFASLLPDADPADCWEWMGRRNKSNYGVLSINGRRLFAHRVSLTLSGVVIPAGMLVCHRCDNPPCCNPSHLFVGTEADNMRDCVEKGRICRWNGKRRGEANPCAKLTADEVRIILASEGAKCVDLAKRFGVVPTTITNIRARRIWRHIK